MREPTGVFSMAKKLVSLVAASALALGAVAVTNSAQAQTVYAGYGYSDGYYNSWADAGPFGIVMAPFALAAGLVGATAGLVAAPFTGGYVGYPGYGGDFAGYYGDAWYDQGYYTTASYYNASPGWVYSNGASGVYIAKYKGKVQRKHLK
jgi:hypothetical protein